MRFGTVVTSVAVALTLLGCSRSEEPVAKPAPAPPAANAPAAVQQPSAVAKPEGKPAPLPTLALQAPAALSDDPRRKQTPCDRSEPGWKWTGNLVENGQCVVGPCDCVKE